MSNDCAHGTSEIDCCDCIPVSIIAFGLQTFQISFSTPAVWELFRCKTRQEFYDLSGGSFENLVYPSDLCCLSRFIACLADGEGKKEGCYRFRIVTRDGEVRAIEGLGRARCAGGGVEAVMVLTETYASNDWLTLLLNKTSFLESASVVLRNAERHGAATKQKFVFFNIRNFKGYNVRMSPQQGDRLLVRLAEILADAWCGSALVSRFSNDFFVVMTESDKCDERIRSIIDEFNGEFGADGVALKAGVYCVRGEGENPERACDLAKYACDMARDSHEDMIVYNGELSHSLELEDYVCTQIISALEDGRICVYYQPVVRSLTGELCGAEALARWIDDEKGPISPAEFVPVLERSHQIHLLDSFVIRRVCRDMSQLVGLGKEPIPVSVNLSRLDFAACDMFDVVERATSAHGVARDMLNIEVTESTIAEDPELMRKVIDRFRGAGYQVWMDDFGSGYSSLNVLKDYCFDEVKLDMVFLRSFDDRSKTIIKSIVSMSKALGIQTLAEGVETREQFDFLRQIGCEKVQGYYFGKPMDGPSFMPSLAEKGIHPEPHDFRALAHTMGALDMLTDKPLAVIECVDGRFVALFHNAAYDAVWGSVGVAPTKEIDGQPNYPASILGGRLRDFVTILTADGGRRVFDITVEGSLIRIDATFLGTYGGGTYFISRPANLTPMRAVSGD